jgi:hypothetical protein
VLRGRWLAAGSPGRSLRPNLWAVASLESADVPAGLEALEPTQADRLDRWLSAQVAAVGFMRSEGLSDV